MQFQARESNPPAMRNCATVHASAADLLALLPILQATNTEVFDPLVPKAHNSECENILFSLQIKPV